MTANYYLSLKEIWERFHKKDIPETNFDWQSWSRKEQSLERDGDKKQ